MSSLDLPSVAFFGRRFHEYQRFFGLTTTDLAGRTVLDVAAGPASFTAEASARGLDVTAVDPLYGCRPAALATHVHLDYARVTAQVSAHPDHLNLATGPFPSIAAAMTERRAAADTFLADYAAHFPHGRYIGAALPQLPFADASHDLVLCAHLLFIYPRLFDEAFHLAAVRELLRIARHEVRLHPLCGPDGNPSPLVPPLRAALAAESVTSTLLPVPLNFFRGTDTTLILHPAR